MKVYITSEYRFSCLPDGTLWTETAFPYSYWARYLQVFEQVSILARVKQVNSVQPGWKRVDGNGVNVCSLPDYVGPFQYALVKNKIKKKIVSILNETAAIILSVPSPIALIAEKVILKKQLPYGAEVMGDPWEVFSSTGIRHPLRIYFRYALTYRMKRQIAGASAISYVTQKTLQKRYPAFPQAFSVGVSNIDLFPEHLAACARTFSREDPVRLISVGSLEQLYKNPDVVLKALALCLKDGINIHLTWIGGGKFLPELKALAADLNIQNKVRFLGQVPAGESIRYQLDEANLFVLASKTEGMPRALIEAMARALPCIGSDVGGISELLEPDEVFLPNSPDLIYRKIKEVTLNTSRMNEMAQRNLIKSAAFLKEKLDGKKFDFLQNLKNKTGSALK